MLGVLAGTVAPVFAIALAGAWLARRGVLDPSPISKIALYVLGPALIFSSISRTSVPVGELARVAAGVVALIAALYALGLVVTWLAGASDGARSGYLLATVFMNSGNFGLPVVLFAFGEEGFAVGALYFVTQSTLANTAGAYVASRGKRSPREALAGALRVPTPYAALLALPFPLLGAQPPEALVRPLDLLGRAAVPLMLLLLGAQLRLRVRPHHAALAGGAIVTRLVVSPLIAAALARTLGFGPLTTAVFVVESAMPTAVITLLLALEFEGDTELLAGVVAYSTLLSVVSLSVLIPLVR